MTAAPASAPGTDKITGGVVLIGCVFMTTLVAGFDDNLGHLLMVIMLSFILLWLMNNGAPDVNKWLGKILCR